MTTLAAKPQTPSRSPSGKPAHLTTYLSRSLSFSLSRCLSLSLLRTHIFSLPACIAFRFDSFSVLLLYMFYTAVLLLPGASFSLSLSLLLPAPLPCSADLPDEALQHFCIANVEIHLMPALYIDLRVAALSALTLQQPPVASAGILCH